MPGRECPTCEFSSLWGFYYAMDGAACETNLGVGRFIDFHQHFILLGLDNGAEDSADGLDTIAALELLEHALALAFLFLLALHHEDIKDNDADHEHEHRALEELDQAGLGGLRGRGDGGGGQDRERRKGHRQNHLLKGGDTTAIKTR